MWESKYEYLKSFKKDELINFLIEKDKRIQNLTNDYVLATKKVNEIKKNCEDKIKDMEERHDKQKYREWKQHVDTRYLDRYLNEWLSEHLKLNLNFGYDGCDSKQLEGGLYLDTRKISNVQSYL